MGVVLASNSYGKSAVRLVKVIRHGARHEIRDLTVDIALEGAFERAHRDGDNSDVLPTDTMKNTVYARAAEDALGAPEEFALVLARHFLGASPSASVSRVRVAEHGWRRLPGGADAHDHAFEHAGGEARTATVRLERGQAPVVHAGIEGLVVLKSARSAFTGYPRDGYTTLRETEDRILATSITAQWRYRDASGAAAHFDVVRRAMLAAFSEHDSKSVQHTLYAMGQAALDACAAMDEIRLTMPNRHHLVVDLTPFGLPNTNEIFVPAPEPYGLIEATLRRE